MKILLVDDDRLILELYKEIFNLWRYESVCVSNAIEAVVQCWLHNFDFIIIDVILPGKNGFELAVEIRKTGLRCPLVFWTGHEVGNNFLKKSQSSNTVLLKKPVSSLELKRTIEHLVISYKERTSLKPIAELEIKYNNIKRFISLSDTIYIGRSKDNDIRLIDERISSHHLVLVRMFEDYKTFYRVIDGEIGGRASTNGVFVNGVRLAELDYRDLNNGDEISIPNTLMTYRLINRDSDSLDDTYT